MDVPEQFDLTDKVAIVTGSGPNRYSDLGAVRCQRPVQERPRRRVRGSPICSRFPVRFTR